MRKLARVAALVAGAAVITTTLLSGGAFAASSITAPSTNPFTVPGNATGVPQPFTVTATGFAPNTPVYVEQCDGTPATAVGWDAAQNCDLGTSPSPVSANASGTVTFPTTNPNFRFTPFKGTSPQGLFNCLSPTQTASNNGLPDFKNCQLRVSSNNTVGTSDQVFLTLTLPNAVVTPPPPTSKLSCKLSGSIGLNPAVTSTVAAKPKDHKIKGSGNLGSAAGTACTRNNPPVTKYPVSSGSVKIKGALPAATVCSQITNPPFAGTTLSVKWQGINPKNNKLGTIGKSAAVVSSVTPNASPFGYTLTAPVSAGIYAGGTLKVNIALDTSSAALVGGCNAVGTGFLGFTGALATSTITLT